MLFESMHTRGGSAKSSMKQSQRTRRRAALRRAVSPVERLEDRTLLSVNSFDFSRGFTGNSITLNGGSAYAGASLALADTATANEARSAFYSSSVPISAFTTNFTVQLANAGDSGFTLAMQEAGASAVGASGAGLGYGGLTNSVAVAFSFASGSSQTGLFTNGTIGATTDLSASGINLHGADPIAVHVSYSGSSLAVSEVDVVTSATASQTYSINLASALSAPSAFIGFTAGTASLGASVKLAGWDYEDQTNPASLGLNINNLTYYDPDMLFADAMKTASSWGSLAKPYDASATVDANGWPMQDAGVMVMNSTGTNINGAYALTFTGQASSIYGVACSVTVQNKTYNASTNTTTATLMVKGSQLMLDFSGTRRVPTDTTATGITNVQLLRPSAPGSTTPLPPTAMFNPTMLAMVEKFTTVRFMEYSQTNQSLDRNWSDRTLPSQIQTGPHGGAWEYAVALCNAANRDLWINIPEMATPQYVTNLANLIRYGSDGVNPYTSPQANPVYAPLNANLKVYFEISNETWNILLPQCVQNNNAASAEVAAGNSPLNYDGATYYFTWSLRRTATLVMNASNIFRGVFGDGQMMSRVRPLVSYQYQNLNSSCQVQLDFLNNYYNNADGIQHVINPHPVNYYVWGGSGAWYGKVGSVANTPPSVVPADGSFETPLVTNYQADPTGASWSFSGTSGIVANGSALKGSNAFDGTQAAYLQNTGSFSETVNFTGDQAAVSWYDASNSVSGERYEVLLDGVAISSSHTAPYSTYHVETSNVFATGSAAGPHTLTFEGLGGGTTFIDDVTVTTVGDYYNSGVTPIHSEVLGENIWTLAYGLHVAGYEGGFAASVAPVTPLEVAANFDPRAQAAEVSNLQQYFQDGGDLGMFFVSTGNSAYGLTLDPANLSSPKMLGIEQFEASGAPAPSVGAQLPSVVGQSATTPQVISYLYPNSSANASPYILQATTAGTYTVTIHGTQTDPNGLAHFMIDGVPIPGYVSLPTGAAGTSAPITFTVTSPGLHGLSLFVDGPGAVSLDNGSLTFTCVSSTPALPAAPPAATGLVASATALGANSLSWNGSSGAAGYRVLRSGDGVHYSIAGAVTGSTSFVDATAVPGVPYWYQIVAYATGGFAAPSSAAQVTSLPATLQFPFVDQDINYPYNGGYATYNSGSSTWTIAGTTATPIPNPTTGMLPPVKKDQFNFLSAPIDSKSFVEQAQITGMSDAGGSAGLMVRDSAAANGAAFGVLYSPSQGVTLFSRATAGTAAVISAPLSVGAAPIWLRITASGGSYTGYYSTDGVNWQSLAGAQSVAIPTLALVGVAVSSESAFVRNIATIAGLQTVPPAPTGLSAVAPPPPGKTAPGSAGGGVSLSWNPVSGANTYNVYRSTAAGGEAGHLLASGLTATSYADSTAAAGVGYYYFVTAVGSLGESFPSAQAPTQTDAAGATQLAFLQFPPTTLAGVSMGTVLVALEDSNGNVITTDNATVSLTLSGSNFVGGSNTVTATAKNGIATFTGLVTNVAAYDNFTAAAPSVAPAVSGSFSIIPGPAAKLAFSVQPASIPAGASITPTVVVEDAYNNVVTSDLSTVTLTLSSGQFPNLSGSATLLTKNGVAAFSLPINNGGTFTLSAADGPLAGATSNAFTVTAQSTGAAKLAFVQGPTSATAGATIAPAITVAVQDSSGNTVSSDASTVTLTLSGGATFASGSTTATAAAQSGVATFSGLAIKAVGSYTLTATDASLTSAVSSPFNITPAAAAAVAFVQQPTAVTAGAAISPAVTVQVVDAFGNRVTTDASTVTLTLSSGHFAGGSATAVAQASAGLASFSGLAVNVAGSYTLAASDAALSGASSSSFAVNPASAAALAFVQQPTAVTAGAAISPAVTVQVIDAFGNRVTGDASTVTLTLSSGTFSSGSSTAGSQASAGLATFSSLVINNPGSYSLAASDASLAGATSSTFMVTGVGSTAAALAFVQQPTATAAGAAISPAVTVAVTDGHGNRVMSDGSTVTLTLSGGAKFSSGLTTATATAASGLATFSALTINAAGSYSLSASDGALTSATSSSFTVTPAAAKAVAFVQQPTAGTAGATISPAVTVQVIDAFGNRVTSDASMVTLTLSSGHFAGGSATAVAQASAGLASFSGLAVNVAGSYTLAATDAALSGASSTSFAVNPASAAALAFVQQPSAATAGAAIAPAVTVQVVDAFGNRVVGDSSTVTLTLSSNAFAGGSTTATAQVSGGLATFSSLVINTAASYTLTASDASLTSALSSTFVVKAAAATAVAFVQQPLSASAGATLSPAVTVRVVDSFGNRALTDSSTISVTLSSGTFAGGSNTATAQASTGLATFSGLAIDTAGNFTLSATDGALTGATSVAFSISAAAASQLGFVQQPAGAAAGATLGASTVAVLDAYGNRALTNTSAVTLTLSSGVFGSGSASVTVNANNGLGTFTGLTEDVAGSYTLTASDGTLTTATSSSFTVVPAAASKLLFKSSPTSGVAGSALAGPAVEVTDAYGNVVNNSSTVTLKLSSGLFSSGSASATATAAAGLATFSNLAINSAGSYTLSATDGSLTAAVSPALTITAAAPSAARSTVSLSTASVVVGATLTVTLTAIDAYGNPLATGGAKVAFSLTGAGTSGGTFSAVTDHGNGVYTAVFTATTAGTARTVSATLNSAAVTSTLPAVTVTAAPLTAKSAIFHATQGRLATNTVASFVYNNSSTPASSFAASINWGDGQSSTGTIVSDGGGNFHVVGSHMYAAPSGSKSYAITVTITGPASVSAKVVSGGQVLVAMLVAISVPTITVAHGTPLTSAAITQFRDDNTLASSPGAYAISIAWGDSATSSAAAQYVKTQSGVGVYWNVIGSHTYAAKGTYTVTITVSETAYANSVVIHQTINVT